MDLDKVRAFLWQKPALITSFPDWLLPPSVIEGLKDTEHVTLGEIAGRDSIAALLIATEQHPIQAILPTIAYTGTEFGNWENAIQKCRLVAERLRERNITVYEPIFLGAPRFWWSLCGRSISYLINQFGFYTPCLGCHLYLHALRIPLAKRIGAPYIIAGEREKHDGRVKLNQVAVALDIYKTFVGGFGLELLLPLRHIHAGAEIEKIIDSDWKEGEGQLQCVLSKNYQDIDGGVTYDEGRIRRFFEEFAVPLAERIIRAYLDGKEPDYETLAETPSLRGARGS